MALQENLIEKMSITLLNMGLSNGIVEKFESYIAGDLEEEHFFSLLFDMNLAVLSDDIVEQLASTHRFLERQQAKEYIGKYIRMLFKIGKLSTFSIIDKFYSPYYKKETVEKLLQYKVKPAFAIAYYADGLSASVQTFNISCITFFDSLYEECWEEFEEAFDMSEMNPSIIIAAYLVQKKDSRQKNYCKWVESVIFNSIKVLFDNGISNDDIEIVVNYLKGNTANLEEITEKIETQKNLKFDTYILRLIMGSAYLILNESEVARKFIKFAISNNYIVAFNILSEVLIVQKNSAMLVEKLQIKKELYIAWMGNTTSLYSLVYDNRLMNELTSNKESFIKAIQMCNGINKAYMASFLWKQGEGYEFVSKGEEVLIHEFSDFMNKVNVEESTYASFIKYLKGELPFESIENSLEGLLGNKEYYISNNRFERVLFWLKNVSSIFEKTMKLLIKIGNSNILIKLFNEYKEAYKEKELESFIDLLKGYGASVKNYLSFLGAYAIVSYNRSENNVTAEKIVIKLIAEEEKSVIESIEVCDADTRAYLLDKLFKNNKEKNSEILIKYLGDSSKAVREKVVELLSDYEEAHEIVIGSLNSKKQIIRENSVKILSKYKNESTNEALNKALEVEKSEKVKTMIREVLNSENTEEDDEELDILEYCKKSVKSNKAAIIKWLDFDTLPKVKMKEDNKFAEDEIVKYILIAYSDTAEVTLNGEAKRVSEVLNKQDLAELAQQVFGRWIASGAEMKKKWVLAFASIHGDYRIISLLKKSIETWAENARGAIASEAVKALALNGSNEAFIIVDNISRKFKFKQVKNAAALALEFAAKEMGIDKEELSDKIVPDLGFDIRGERTFDYGERKFIARLTPELTVEVYDEDNKQLKNLPAPNKKDDEDKAKVSSLEFKALKKQLKTVVSIQAIRIEMALSTNRKWSKEAWVKLFVENPIMHQFATGLVWGTYKENKLADTFRYMEDGSFNTKDEDIYEIEDTSKIGIVHPIELEEETLALWKEQLENYEIKQPFEQLNREVFKVSEEEKSLKRVERFGGIVLNGLSLLGKLTGFEWYRGSIQDAGGYYTFYKEDKTLNIGVELGFSGVSVGYENEEVTLYGLTFYKAGTVERGSYIYDKIKDENVILPSQVPERFFSEILYQLNKVSISKIDTNPNWRKEE